MNYLRLSSSRRSMFVGLAAVLLTATSLPAQTGSVNWGRWTFDWEVAGNRGLGIRNVRFDNELFIFKANMPVIRVKYVKDFGWAPWDWNGCGPYQDRIDWGSLVPTTVSSSKVLQRSFTSGGVNFLELGAYARIGAYHIYQAYYLGDNGQVDVRVFSRGLSCNMDHDHHPYWRFDFDVNGASGDQIIRNQVSSGVTNNLIYGTEQNDNKWPPGNRRWFVKDVPTGKGVWVIPGNDGMIDAFSTKDVGARRYAGSEDEDWPFGAKGHLGYSNGQNINQQDVVLWYVAHMHHVASQGGGVWHMAGPTLFMQR